MGSVISINNFNIAKLGTEVFQNVAEILFSA
jgi:hypothetical protein